MSNNIQFHSMQPTQVNSQGNLYNYHHHHHRRHHHHVSQTPQTHDVSSYSNHRLNQVSNGNHPLRMATPLLPLNQSSAYFLDRIDLENYTTQSLKQTVENILSKTKSKGLKVKLSLPDDGLIIENCTDSNQSWIFKTSELLYFWRDPYYLNVIVVVTINRARNQSTRPYSASIFHLRGGTESAQLFLQQAQQFFGNLSTLVSNNKTSTIAKPTRNQSVEKSTRSDNHRSSSSRRSNSKSLSIISEPFPPISKPTLTRHQSPQTTGIRRVTRAEFDPGKTTVYSVDSVPNHRTYSETASSTDSQTTNSTQEILSYTKKLNDDEDDKMTTISNNFSVDQVTELMRELKELRNEIASLKLAKKVSPVTRAMSTSPLAKESDYSKRNHVSSTTTSSPSCQDITSQSEVDAETQTDFSLVNHRRRQISRENKKTMIGSSGVPPLNKQKSSRNNQRTFSSSSANTVSDQEEPTSDRSSKMNDRPNDPNLTIIPEQYQPIISSAPPRPVLIRNQNTFTPFTHATSYSNSTEEGSLSVSAEKEVPTFLSTNVPSSKSDMNGPTISLNSAGVSNFRSVVENSTTPSEHIYENVPISIQSNSNREAYYNIPIVNADESQQNQPDDRGYYTINNNYETESEQQYLLPGQTISNSPPTTDQTSDTQPAIIQQQKPQIVSAGRHRNQPIYFANHLTNPVFNVDKQLLTNTIANQFGVDLNSPQLQQLITNQHLFVSRKRTFANMVWQLTPEEETALYSSPPFPQTKNLIDIETNHSNQSTARPILKAAKRLYPSSKRRTISWDNALE